MSRSYSGLFMATGSAGRVISGRGGVGRARVWPSFGRDFFMLFSDLAGLTCVGPGK